MVFCSTIFLHKLPTIRPWRKNKTKTIYMHMLVLLHNKSKVIHTKLVYIFGIWYFSNTHHQYCGVCMQQDVHMLYRSTWMLVNNIYMATFLIDAGLCLRLSQIALCFSTGNHFTSSLKINFCHVCGLWHGKVSWLQANRSSPRGYM